MEPKSRASTIVTHTNRYETCLEIWSGRRLVSIQRPDVVKLHHSIGKERGQAMANRAIQLLRAVINFAIRDLGQLLVNPASAIEMYREHPRERFLKADEMPRFFQAVASLTDPSAKDFILLCLFTGARRGNVQSMRWDAIDFDAATWTILGSSFKTHKTQSVVLAGPALEILQRRLTDRVSDQWVFPSHSKTGHLVESKTAWIKVCKIAGLPNLTLHNLRRTLGSWQAASGSSLQVIGASLGHQRMETTAIYSRLQMDPVRASVEKATAAIALAGNNSNRTSRAALASKKMRPAS